MQYYQNIISDPNFAGNSFPWIPNQLQGASATFTYANGLRVQVTDAKDQWWKLQVFNSWTEISPVIKELSILQSAAYILIVDAKTNASQREIVIDVDTGNPDYFSLLTDSNKMVVNISTTYTNLTFCFNPSIDDNSSRVVISMGGNLYNSYNDVFIRGIYLIPVPSCSLTSGELQLTSGQLENYNSLSQVPSEGQRNLLAPIIGAVVGIAVVIVVVIIVLAVRRKAKGEKGKELNILPDFRLSKVESIKGSIRMHNSENIDINDLIFHEQIGVGAFGVVYRGEWRKQLVAIKKMRSGLIDSNELKVFQEEIEAMLSITPRTNILQFLGACCSDLENLCLVTEFCKNGSMDNYIKDNPPMSKTIAFEIIKSIAAGMSHLAEEGVVHRDLSARNILLNESLVPKIADFGLARVVYDTSGQRTTNSAIGPIKWMAPESLDKRSYSQKSDVWMFGCSCHEIVFGEHPYHGLKPLECAAKVVKGELHPSIPSKEEWGILHDIMSDCFKYEPSQRPTFSEIYNRLNEESDSMLTLLQGNTTRPSIQLTPIPGALYGSVEVQEQLNYNNNRSDQIFYMSK